MTPTQPPQPAPTILAVDATAAQCSVALIHGAQTFWRAEAMSQGHARHLVGMMDAVLHEAGLAGSAVDALAFGAGPGAFTSLRIACGVVQGLALAWDKPVLAIDAMRTLADQARQAVGSAATMIWVTLDVRMGEVCFGAVVSSADSLGAPPWWVAPALGAPEVAMRALDAVAAAQPGPYCLAGDGPDAYPALAEWWAGYSAAGLRPVAAIQPDARAVARLAQHDYVLGLAQDPAQVAPWYLRDKVALDLTEQQALRQQREAARHMTAPGSPPSDAAAGRSGA